MSGSLTETIREIGELLLRRCRDGDDIGEALRGALVSFLAPSFGIGFLGVTSSTGETLIEQALIIYTPSDSAPNLPAGYVTAANVAGVIYVTKMLNEEALADGYMLIGRVKALPRHDTVAGDCWHHVPVGIIVALDCDRPLEKLVDAISQLNLRVPSTRWADAVSVLSRGIINYAVQFEGNQIQGNFILPSTVGALQFAMYVHVMVSSLGTYTYNRICGTLLMHLGCFSGKTELPTSQMVMEGVNRLAVNTSAYMFNRADLLVPVPDRMRQDRGYGLNLVAYRVESRGGELLSRVQLVPWLDGGAAIRVFGKFPLMPFIIFLGKMNDRVQQIKTPDGLISSILPIQKQEFEFMLARMCQQSNMVIKPEQPSWTVVKMADEGTRSPFMARLFLNILNLRRSALQGEDDVSAFEKSYQLVLMSSITVRDLSLEIERLLVDHQSKVARGVGIRVEGHTVHVDEPIDKELRRLIEAFLNSSNRVMVTGMKEVARALHLDISFFFKKEATFEKGVTALHANDPRLANYCRRARVWSDMLNSVRNEMEHNFWSLPRVQYKIDKESVSALEPEVIGRPVTSFAKFITDRMLCFIEELCVHGMQRQMPDGISVTEFPFTHRPKERPERFTLCTAGGGMPLWEIAYHESSFDET